MKAILMAAGMGTRISEKTNNPKCLLDIGNGPLIAHTVDLLTRHQIDVTICLGYKGECIKEALANYPVTYYENPFYKVTNSIASLWFARDMMDSDEDILFANADVFWQEDILKLLTNDSRDVVLLGDVSRKLTGDYFFTVSNERLLAYGKELLEEERTCEYVGLAKISASFLPAMKQRLMRLVKEGDYQLWWENTLYSMIKERDIYVKDVQDCYWSEIDVIADYESILNYVSLHGNK